MDNNLMMFNIPRNLDDDSKRKQFDVRLAKYKILIDNMLYL